MKVIRKWVTVLATHPLLGEEILSSFHTPTAHSHRGYSAGYYRVLISLVNILKIMQKNQPSVTLEVFVS